MPATLLFDRSSRVRIRFTGPKTIDTVNGLVTNDLVPLKPGQGCYACVLTAKSKILADVRIFRVMDQELLLDTSHEASSGLLSFFKKYVNPRLSKFEDVTDSTNCFTVAGPKAAEILSKALNIDAEALAGLAPYAHLQSELQGRSAMIVSTPELSMPAFDIIFEKNGETEQADLGFFTDLGLELSSNEVWRSRQVETGWPAWGTDMDEETLPQEANMVELHAISFTKGCYIGQETVSRIHFRGRVNKYLRVLAFAAEGAIPTASDEAPLSASQLLIDNPPVGAELFNEEGKLMGNVTSCATLTNRSVVGIGMVRREIENGKTLTARWGEDLTCSVLVLKTAQGTA